MTITNEFRQAINNKDTRMIRIMLKDSLVVDPTFAEFNQMHAIAEANLEDLYDEHDGETLRFDFSEWTKEYMDDQMVQVVYNFSKERIDLLKKICKHLYRDRANEIVQVRMKSSSQIQISRKQVGAGLAIGGAVVTAAGLAIDTAVVTAVSLAVVKPVVVAVGIAGVVAGGVLIMTDKQGKKNE